MSVACWSAVDPAVGSSDVDHPALLAHMGANGGLKVGYMPMRAGHGWSLVSPALFLEVQVLLARPGMGQVAGDPLVLPCPVNWRLTGRRQIGSGIPFQP